MRDIETIDSELRLVATLRHAARERGGPLPSIDVTDALLDERWSQIVLPGTMTATPRVPTISTMGGRSACGDKRSS
jgi:hypothetical protein